MYTTEQLKYKITQLWKEIDETASAGHSQHAFNCIQEAEYLEFLLSVKEAAINKIIANKGGSYASYAA